MEREHFFEVTGLEDFIESLESDRSEKTLIPLIFTKPRIRKVTKGIKNYAEEASGIKRVIVEAGDDYDIKDFKWTEELNRDLGPDLDYFGVHIEFESWLGRKLDKLYPGKEKDYKEWQESENPSLNPDYLKIWWDVVPHNRRYWYTTLRGRPICARNFRKAVTENPKFHELCESPKEYKEICGNLTALLRKYAFPLDEK